MKEKKEEGMIHSWMLDTHGAKEVNFIISLA